MFCTDKNDPKFNFLKESWEKFISIKDPIKKANVFKEDVIKMEKLYNQESPINIRSRVHSFLKELVESEFKNIIIITHRGIIYL